MASTICLFFEDIDLLSLMIKEDPEERGIGLLSAWKVRCQRQNKGSVGLIWSITNLLNEEQVVMVVGI